MLKDLIALDNSSKVWIYQADREISYDELDDMRPQVFNFMDQWSSHNIDLIGYANIFHQRFLALFVDEFHSGASGCSIDKSVRFIESLGTTYGIDFFDRNTFAYLKEDEIFTVSKRDLNQALADKRITSNTLFFDNLVKTKADFLKAWLVPLSQSWHGKLISK